MDAESSRPGDAPLATGRCWCGQVRVRLYAEPITVRVCWCRDCRYVAAGNGSVNLRLRREAVAIEGELLSYRSTAASGNAMTRTFCPRCGTPVTSESAAAPELMVLRAGLMDDADRFPPVANIWTDSAPDWACIDESLPSYPGQPPPR